MKPLTISLLLACTFPGALHADVIPKIAFVDFAQIQREFYRTYQEREQFETKRQQELDRIEEPQRKLDELYQQQQRTLQQLEDPTLNASHKDTLVAEGEERRGQILSLRRETLDLERRIEAELNAAAEAVQRSLTKEIYDAIGELAAAQGYDLVLNRSFGMMGVPTIPYSSTKNLPDLTQSVLADLNANAPAGWSPPAE